MGRTRRCSRQRGRVGFSWFTAHIAASVLSGAGGGPDWQRVAFSPAEFVVAFAGLRDSFVTALRQASPGAAEAWLARFARN